MNEGGRRWQFWSFVVLMLALTALFVGLGTWQLRRLAEKEALIARVEARAGQPPAPFSSLGVGEEGEDDMNFRVLSMTGHYLPEETVLVFTALSEAKGPYAGPGYWVMTPFALADDSVVFVNRGFVPQSRGPDFAGGAGIDRSARTLVGIARDGEQAGPFTPAADARQRLDYVRDPQRLAALAGTAGAVAPFVLDLPAGPAGSLPQGGETEIAFPNNHLGYAITWFGFALITPLMLVEWARRQRRPAVADRVAAGAGID